jgi:hypothetical protein
MLYYPHIPSCFFDAAFDIVCVHLCPTTLNLDGTHSLISIPTSWDAGTIHKIIPSLAFQREFVHSGKG